MPEQSFVKFASACCLRAVTFCETPRAQDPGRQQAGLSSRWPAQTCTAACRRAARGCWCCAASRRRSCRACGARGAPRSCASRWTPRNTRAPATGASARWPRRQARAPHKLCAGGLAVPPCIAACFFVGTSPRPSSAVSFPTDVCKCRTHEDVACAATSASALRQGQRPAFSSGCRGWYNPELPASKPWLTHCARFRAHKVGWQQAWHPAARTTQPGSSVVCRPVSLELAAL
jgi:hypothetical protein